MKFKALAKSLSAEAVDLRRNSDTANTMPTALTDWIARLDREAQALISRHPEDRVNEKLVRAAGNVLSQFKRADQRGETWGDELALLSDKSISRNLKDWDEADIGDVLRLVLILGYAGNAQQLLDAAIASHGNDQPASNPELLLQ